MRQFLSKPPERLGPGGTKSTPHRPARPPRRSEEISSDVEAEPRSCLKLYRLLLAALVLEAIAWGGSQFFNESATPTAKPSPIKMVTLQATPPPPPPPPPPPKLQPPPPQEEKMIEQTPVAEEEPKPEEPAPADDPPADLGTNIQGDGPADGFGLSGNKGNGGGTGRGLGGSGAKASSRWGWYAAKVQSGIGEALRRHPRTREAVLNHKVRVWPDRTGRITRAKLESSTGDASLDAAITSVLTGVQLAEAPPAEMPAPILLRLSARRP